MTDFAQVLAMLIVFGSPVAAFIVFRVLAHKERMEMIRNGMPPIVGGKKWERRAREYAEWSARANPQPNDFGAPPRPGPTPPPRPTPPPFATGPVPPGKSPEKSVHDGVVTAAIGLALTIGLSFIGYHSDGGAFGGPTIHPGPWLLGGLIPMFVGIAQIINGVLGGAVLGGVNRRPYVPPCPEPPPCVRDATPQPGRTDDQPRIARPVPPPDLR
jgi:hypothetical protein